MIKEKLQAILKNPNDKLIAVDLDGTLCEGEYWGKGISEEPKPLQNRIDYFNSLYKKGAHIIIYTARFPDMYQETFAWLTNNGVLFHGICVGKKPGADIYIDDKALNIEDVII